MLPQPWNHESIGCPRRVASPLGVAEDLRGDTGVVRIALFLLAIVAALVMRWLTAHTVYALVPAE